MVTACHRITDTHKHTLRRVTSPWWAVIGCEVQGSKGGRGPEEEMNHQGEMSQRGSIHGAVCVDVCECVSLPLREEDAV